jgi:hypothetical protein
MGMQPPIARRACRGLHRARTWAKARQPSSLWACSRPTSRQAYPGIPPRSYVGLGPHRPDYSQP